MNETEKVFREFSLFTREEILKSLELFIEHEKTSDEMSYTPAVKKNRVRLCEKFYKTVKKAKVPALTELWWFYEYQLNDNGIELELCQASDVTVEDDNIKLMTSTVEQVLISIESEYLTLEKYADMLEVDASTVMQWIRRGKMRFARKNGQQWMIPNTQDKPQRGFDSVQYTIDEGKVISSNEFPLLAASDSISIIQDTKKKGKYICYFRNYKTDFRSHLELTRNEVADLEYTIIESGKAKIGDGIQYVPQFSKADE